MPPVKTSKGLELQKITDLTTQLKGVPNLTYFAAPVYDGHTYAFFGSTPSTQSKMEGIYGILNPGDPVERISDIQTVIPDLQGPPTSAEGSSGHVRHAYLPYCMYDMDPIAPAMMALARPRPALINGDVVFFAANWTSTVNTSGIFAFDHNKRSYRTLVLTGPQSGNFAGADIAQPVVSSFMIKNAKAGIDSTAMVNFSASNSNGGPGGLPAGVYAVPYTGSPSDIQQLLNINSAMTPDGKQISALSNAQIQAPYPSSPLVVYGQYGGDVIDIDGLFSYSQTKALNMELKRLVKGGDTIGSYTVSDSGTYQEVCVAGKYVVFVCDVRHDNDSQALAYLDLTQPGSVPQLIAVSNGPTPDGSGTFDGQEFADPPTSDGRFVVFTGSYIPASGGELTGLFLWDLQKQSGTKLLDSTEEIEGKYMSTFEMNTNALANGKLAFKIIFEDDSSGVYLWDLNSYK